RQILPISRRKIPRTTPGINSPGLNLQENSVAQPGTRFALSGAGASCGISAARRCWWCQRNVGVSAMSSVSGLGASYNSLAALQQRLFSEIDTSGTGSITEAGLETAVTKAGGTSQAADALYATLDPNNTGSVNEQQFSQNLPLSMFSPPTASVMIGFQALGF